MKKTMYILFSLAPVFLTACSIAGSPDKHEAWKTECVGQYQISLPGKVKVLLPPPKVFSDTQTDFLLARYLLASRTFSDGKGHFLNLDYLPFSRFYVGGDIGITVKVSDVDFENLQKMYRGRKQSYLDEAASDEKEGYTFAAESNHDKAAKVRPLDYDTADMFGWRYKDSALIYLHRDNRIYILNPQLQQVAHAETRAKDVDSFLHRFRLRSLYELPKQRGVCFPYGFIEDAGKAERHVAVTMRLEDHPDVQISFIDGADQEPPKNAINYYGAFFEGQKTRMAAVPFSYGSISMGGQDGKGLFFTITREDGTEDYGYIAYVMGNETAAVDTPSLLLYISRDAALAKGKPVSRNELHEMVKGVLVSIKRRD